VQIAAQPSTLLLAHAHNPCAGALHLGGHLRGVDGDAQVGREIVEEPAVGLAQPGLASRGSRRNVPTRRPW
jgi:hypothetical protein